MFASFDKDYIMRLVKEMVRMLLKLLFDIDVSVSMEEVIKQSQEQETLKRLTKMIDDGFINEAENELYELIDDSDRVHLKTALIFYYHLATKDQLFLANHGYTVQEVKEGTENVIDIYKINDIAEMFMQ